jgi:hypothetical protein
MSLEWLVRDRSDISSVTTSSRLQTRAVHILELIFFFADERSIAPRHIKSFQRY